MNTLKQLYRGDPRWRLAAETCLLGSLVLWLVAGSPFGSGAGSPPQSAQTPCVPAQVGQPGSGNCTPQTPAPPGQPSPNTSGVPTGGITVTIPPDPKDVARSQRLNTFAAAYNHALNEPREGARCELIDQAARRLQDGDLQHATPQVVQAVQGAQTCRSRIEFSDQRLDKLDRHAQAYDQEPLGSNAQLLAASLADIDAFDRSREHIEQYRAALRLGQQASDAMTQSNGNLAALTAAATRFESAPDAQAREALVTATRQLTAFDRQRMTDAQQRAYQLGQQEGEVLRQSDQRLEQLAAALNDARVLDTPANRQRLVEATAAITPLDRQRADAGGQTVIADSEQLAKGFALELLVRQAEGFGEGAGVGDYQSLVATYRSLGGIDETLLTEQQRQALETAKRAAQTLSESDRRISAMTQAASAWRDNPGPAFEAVVRESCGGVTDFDQARFDLNQHRAFQEVQDACRIMDDSVSGQVDRTTAIYVTAETGAPANAPYVRAFTRLLRERGFNVVSDRTQAALVIELAGSIDSQTQNTIGNQVLQGAITSLRLHAFWAFNGQEYLRAAGRGNGANRQEEIAVEQAYGKSAQQIFERFDEQTRF